MTVRRSAGLLATVVLAAIATHAAALALLPTLIVGEIIRRTSADYGINALAVPPQPSAEWQPIVRPSPDFLYGICAYDLTDGPVLLSAPKLGTYTSVALYASNSDNFYVENDRRSAAPAIGLVIARAGDRPATDVPVVVSPSPRGLVLVRVLADDDSSAARAADLLREGRCQRLR
jgi:uncharacterized membrane protein